MNWELYLHDTKMAFVADPKQLDDTSKLKVFCRAIDVLDNMVDFDYASLYPSVIRQFFIAANTQIGRVIIDQKVHDKENRGHIERWSREGAFIEDFQSHNWLEFNCRWLNLPDFEVLYNEILNGEFFKSYIHPKNGFSKYSEDGYINAFTIRESKAKYNIVFERHDTRRMIDDNNFIPFDKNKFAEFRDHATKFVNQQF